MPLSYKIGDKFGRLTIVSNGVRKTISGRKISYVNCLCDCGKIVRTTITDLRTKHTGSCGCLWLEKITKHSLYDSSEYNIWYGMKDRCYNKKNSRYSSYGGRGIKVEWKSLEEFYSDMGKKPKNKTLDRIDNNGNYSKENCKWSTAIQQQNNTRRSHLITYNGKTQTAIQWSREIKIDYGCFLARINRGWSIERAINTPSKKGVKNETA